MSCKNNQTLDEIYSDPQLSYGEKWINMKYEETKIRTISCTDYCKQKSKGRIFSNEREQNLFMKKCLQSCLEYKSFLRWSDMN